MPSVHRSALCAFVLTVLVALALHVYQARAEQASSGPVLALAIVPVPLANDELAPPLAEPVLLCGNRWVTGDYVMPQVCMKACLGRHPPAQCQKLVPSCQMCWSQLLACANNRTIPRRDRCRVCSERYAACMKAFLS